jgi:hypothetical protein
MKEVSIIGIDLAKNVLQLPGAAADGSVRLVGPAGREEGQGGSISRVSVTGACGVPIVPIPASRGARIMFPETSSSAGSTTR